jgi:hypothetical protein
MRRSTFMIGPLAATSPRGAIAAAATLAALAGLAPLLGACPADDRAAVAPDAGGADGSGADGALTPLPVFSVAIEADKVTGNAPLSIAFAVRLEGAVSASEISYAWLIDGSVGYTGDAIEHTFSQAGSFEVALTATYLSPDGRSRVDRHEVTVVVIGCADLHFGQVSLSPPVDVAPGDAVSLLQGKLFNDGDRVAAPFFVQVILSSDAVYEPDSGTLVAEWEVPSMASGLFSETSIDYAGHSFSVPDGFPEGNYFVFLVVDPLGTVNECREDNNRATSTNNLTVDPAVAFKADLTVTGVTFPADLVVKQGQIVSYQFQVKNTGEGDAQQFKLGFWLSSDPVLDAGDRVMFGPADIGATMQQLAAGGSQSFLKSYKIPLDLPDGPYWMIGQVDVNGQVLEDDESNNTAVSAGPFTMKYQEETCFDLGLDHLEVAPLASYWNGTVQVAVTVTNPGTVATPTDWEMRAYLSQQQTLNPTNSTQVGSWKLPPIAPGQTTLVQEIVTIPNTLPVIPHYVGVILDPATKLSECTEGNNAAMFPQPVTIAATASVDVAASNVQFHPKTVTAGAAIKLAYTLGNDGSTGATAFKVGIVFSEDATISTAQVASGQDWLVGEVVVTSVPAADTVPRVEDVIVPIELPHTVSTYHIGVIADLDNALGSDSNKGNNIAVAAGTITVAGAQGGCFEDALEANNTASTAAPLGAGLHAELGSCGNEDWYAIVVPAQHSLLIDLTSAAILSVEPVAADLDLELLDAELTLLDASANAGDAEDVHLFTAAAETEVLLRVFGKTGGVQAAYDLDVQVLPPTDGVDLLPIDVTALPASLYPGGLLNVTFDEVNLGVAASGPHTVRVWASQDGALDAGDVMVRALVVDGVAPSSLAARSADFQLPVEIAGGTWRFLVEVDADDDVVEAREDNNAAASDTVFLDPLLTCEDDDLEPNDGPTLATPLTPVDGVAAVNGAVVCPKLEDWFAVPLVAGASLSAKVTYKHEQDKGLLAVELWDPSGTAVLLKQAAANSAQVLLPWAWRAGTYYVRVSNQVAGGNSGPYSYNLIVATAAGDGASACAPDGFEDNNSMQAARALGCGLQRVTLCKGDIDTYRIELAAGEALAVSLSHPAAELKMALHQDALGPAVASKSGNGTLTWTAEQDETLLLRVQSKGDPLALSSFAYTLFVDGIAGVDLTVDPPSLLLDAVYQGEDTLIDFEIVNACMDAAGPFAATVWLSPDDLLDHADVPVATVGVPGVLANEAVGLSEKVSVPYSTLPGPYFLIVAADSGGDLAESNEANNTNAVPLEVLELCLPDAAEPNDLLAAAPPWAPALAAPGWTGLALCPFEVDWFSVAATGGTTLTVTARFSHAEGDLDLRLYDPSYSTTIPVAKADSKDDDEVITYAVAVDGTLLVRVHGFDGASAGYDLQVTVE